MIDPSSRLTITAEWTDEAGAKRAVTVDAEVTKETLPAALKSLETQIELQAFGRDTFAEMMAMGRKLMAEANSAAG